MAWPITGTTSTRPQTYEWIFSSNVAAPTSPAEAPSSDGRGLKFAPLLVKVKVTRKPPDGLDKQHG